MLRLIFVWLILVTGSVLAVGDSIWALLLYLWWAYFRPDYWVFTTWLYDHPISFVIGTFLVLRATLAGELVFKTDIRSLVLYAILGFSTLSTFQSDYYVFAWPYLWDFSRTALITFMISLLATDTKRLRLIILGIAMSLGFEAAKQGWAQMILNPGAANMNDVAFLGDNNLVAIGMLMLVCLLVALTRTAKYRIERWLYIFLTIGVLYRAISTYSRGGFLAAIGLGLIFIARSPRKIRAITGAVIAAVIVTSVLPDQYWTRMETIDVNRPVEEGQAADDSALGRLHFWAVAVAMAADHPILGIGLNAYTAAYDRYDFSDGQYGRRRSVHSMWYGYLAELGFVGAGLFVTALFLAFVACWRARRLAKRGLVSKELGHYATGLESALVVVMIGGTFVIFQQVEILWHVIGLSMAVNSLTLRELAQQPVVVRPVAQPSSQLSLPAVR